MLHVLNLRYGLPLHVGHGYRNSMSCGDATLVNSDASGLTNGTKLFNLYAIDCTSSAIDFPCIGEAFLKNPNGGSVSVVGYRNSMSCGDATLVHSDATGLTNGTKLFNLYAIDCRSSAIDFPCIGEAF